jgi:hypothetical protein
MVRNENEKLIKLCEGCPLRGDGRNKFEGDPKSCFTVIVSLGEHYLATTALSGFSGTSKTIVAGIVPEGPEIDGPAEIDLVFLKAAEKSEFCEGPQDGNCSSFDEIIMERGRTEWLRRNIS